MEERSFLLVHCWRILLSIGWFFPALLPYNNFRWIFWFFWRFNFIPILGASCTIKLKVSSISFNVPLNRNIVYVSSDISLIVVLVLRNFAVLPNRPKIPVGLLGAPMVDSKCRKSFSLEFRNKRVEWLYMLSIVGKNYLISWNMGCWKHLRSSLGSFLFPEEFPELVFLLHLVLTEFLFLEWD